MKKGIFHIHTNISYDGLNSFSSIIRFIKKNKLDFIVITDHDTIQGSIKFSEYAKKNNINIEIPVAAEYKTSKGDIIAAYIKEEIINLEWDDFYNEVKNQGGILILPHPFDSHKDVEYLASKVDVIEVFNSRSSVLNNFKSYQLAIKFNKPIIWSSDSHIYLTLKNCILAYQDANSLNQAITNGKLTPLSCKSSSYLDIYMSQIKKSIVRKNFKLFITLNVSLVINVLNTLINKLTLKQNI
jgi:predicted metal-dependent phosphoesterase TrpH